MQDLTNVIRKQILKILNILGVSRKLQKSNFEA